MFRKIAMAALLGIIGTATFASTASAHEREFRRFERRGDFDRRDGFYGERFERREGFEHMRRERFLPHRELRERGYRGGW